MTVGQRIPRLELCPEQTRSKPSAAVAISGAGNITDNERNLIRLSPGDALFIPNGERVKMATRTLAISDCIPPDTVCLNIRDFTYETEIIICCKLHVVQVPAAELKDNLRKAAEDYIRNYQASKTSKDLLRPPPPFRRRGQRKIRRNNQNCGWARFTAQYITVGEDSYFHIFSYISDGGGRQ